MPFPILAAALGLAQFAPAIAHWLGGSQAQDVATKVMDIAQKLTETSDPLEAMLRIRDNADMVMEFKKAMIDLELELSFVKDRQDARMRDIALAKAGRTNRRADIMVIMAAVGLFFCLATLVMFREKLPGEAVGIISMIAGIFGACLKDAYTFEFGSSRGSREKDSTMAAIMERYAE